MRELTIKVRLDDDTEEEYLKGIEMIQELGGEIIEEEEV